MSHDLFFWTPDTEPGPDASALQAWFAARPRYQAEAAQVTYGNDDTGVYFLVDLDEVEPAGDEEGRLIPGGRVVATLHLNYLRPSTFGLEAEPEVRAFVEHFGLRVFDPQVNGMGTGAYDAEAFLRGWNDGNQFGHRAILKDHPARWHLPAAELQRHWRWNRARAGLQRELGEADFVPRITYLDVGGRLATGAVWPDGLPTLLPTVDYALVTRQPSAWRRLLGAKPELLLMPWAAVQPFLPAAPAAGDLPAWRAGSAPPPRGLAAALKGLPPFQGHAQGIPCDQVLDRELVEAAATPAG